MLTVEILKEHLFLNPSDWKFYWVKKVRGVKIGQKAGSYDAYGYGQIKIQGEIYKEHRLVWLYMTGEFPNGQIDHVNHVRSDNAFSNLRVVNNEENHKNRPMQRNSSTGFVGVSLCKQTGRYEAYINVDGSKIRLGRFADISSAIDARKEANKKYGFHENHGVGLGTPKKLKDLKAKSPLRKQ